MKKISFFSLLLLLSSSEVMAAPAQSIQSVVDQIPSFMFDTIVGGFMKMADEFGLFTINGNPLIFIMFVIGALLQYKKHILDATDLDYAEGIKTCFSFMFVIFCLVGGPYREIAPSIWIKADTVISKDVSRENRTLDRDLFNLVKYLSNEISPAFKGENGIYNKYINLTFYQSYTRAICAYETTPEDNANCLDKFKDKTKYQFDQSGAFPTDEAIDAAGKEYNKIVRDDTFVGISTGNIKAFISEQLGFVPSGKIFIQILIAAIIALLNLCVLLITIGLQVITALEAVIIIFFFKCLCPLMIYSEMRPKILGLFKTFISFALLTLVLDILMFLTDSIALVFFGLLDKPIAPVVALGNFISSVFPYAGKVILSDPSLLGASYISPVGTILLLLIGVFFLIFVGLKLIFVMKASKITKGILNFNFDELIGLSEAFLKTMAQASTIAVGVASGGVGLAAGAKFLASKKNDAISALAPKAPSVSNPAGSVGGGNGAGGGSGMGSKLHSGISNTVAPEKLSPESIISNLKTPTPSSSGLGGGSRKTQKVKNVEDVPISSGTTLKIPSEVKLRPSSMGESENNKSILNKDYFKNKATQNNLNEMSQVASLIGDKSILKGITAPSNPLLMKSGINNKLVSNKKPDAPKADGIDKEKSSTQEFRDKDVYNALIDIKNLLSKGLVAPGSPSVAGSGPRKGITKRKSSPLEFEETSEVPKSKKKTKTGNTKKTKKDDDLLNYVPKDAEDAETQYTKLKKDKLTKNEAQNIEKFQKDIETARDEAPKSFIEAFNKGREKTKLQLSGFDALFKGMDEFNDGLTVAKSAQSLVQSSAKLSEINRKEQLRIFDKNNDKAISKLEVTQIYLQAKESLGKEFDINDMNYGQFTRVMKGQRSTKKNIKNEQ